MSKQANPLGGFVATEPRADLLPPEVRGDRKAQRTRRTLVYGVAGVAVLVIFGIGGATALSLQAQVALNDEQSRSVSLLAQQGKFTEVRLTQSNVALVEAGQQVGASTEVDWKAYLTKVQATLPANVTIDTVSVDSATPLAIFAQSTAPLQGARIATLSFSAKSPTLPEVPNWLIALQKLPGFADAVPGSVTLETSTNIYTANVTMHINEAAFDKRFQPEAVKK